MTKPIKGWVAIGTDRPDLLQLFETEDEAVESYGDDKRFVIRPVLVTFADEPNIEKDLDRAATSHANELCPGQADLDIVWCMSKDDFLRGAKWQAEQTADEIRKERERIWSVFMDSDFFWCASGEMEPHVFKRELGDFKKAIFGEEK